MNTPLQWRVWAVDKNNTPEYEVAHKCNTPWGQPPPPFLHEVTHSRNDLTHAFFLNVGRSLGHVSTSLHSHATLARLLAKLNTLTLIIMLLILSYQYAFPSPGSGKKREQPQLPKKKEKKRDMHPCFHHCFQPFMQRYFGRDIHSVRGMCITSRKTFATTFRKTSFVFHCLAPGAPPLAMKWSIMNDQDRQATIRNWNVWSLYILRESEKQKI